MNAPLLAEYYPSSITKQDWPGGFARETDSDNKTQGRDY